MGISQVPDISRAALLKNADDDAIVAQARELVKRHCLSLEEWKVIWRALLVTRKEAKRKAHTDQPRGPKYNALFGNSLQINGFDRIEKTVRACLLSIAEHEEDVEAYLAGLEPAERARYNHPTNIWRAWICSYRGNRGNPPLPRPTAGKGTCPVSAPLIAAVDAKRRDEKQKTSAGLLNLRLSQIHPLVAIEDWPPNELPDQGQIDLAREVGNKLLALADHFEDRQRRPEAA